MRYLGEGELMDSTSSSIYSPGLYDAYNRSLQFTIYRLVLNPASTRRDRVGPAPCAQGMDSAGHDNRMFK